MSIANKSPTRFKKVAIFLRILDIKNEWGSRGREFKSLHPDQKSLENQGFFHFSTSLYFSLLLSIANKFTNNK